MRSRPGFSLACAATLVALSTLAACSTSKGNGSQASVTGGSGSPTSASKAAAAALSRAVGATTSAGSAAVDVSVALSGDYLDGLAPSDRVTGGVGNYAFLTNSGGSGEGTLRMTLPVLGDCTVIVDGTDIYISPTTQMSAQLRLTKPWIRYDLKSLAESSDAGGGLGEMIESLWGSMTQPITYLSALVPGSARKLGTSVIDGTKTTEYEAVVNANQVITDGNVVQRFAISQLVLGAPSTTFPLYVWVDGKGRVNRFQYTIQLGAPGSSSSTAGAGPQSSSSSSSTSAGSGASGQSTTSSSTSTTQVTLKGSQEVTVVLSEFGNPFQVTVPPQGTFDDESQFLVVGASQGTPGTIFFGRVVG